MALRAVLNTGMTAEPAVQALLISQGELLHPDGKVVSSGTPGQSNGELNCAHDGETGQDSESKHGSEQNGHVSAPVPRIRSPQAREEYPDSLLIKALHAAHGRVYLAAESIGCNPETFARRAKLCPELKAITLQYRKRIVDKAERGLETAVDQGDAWAVQFTLKTLGKSRGYVERTEVESRTEIRGALVQFLAPAQLAGVLGIPIEAIGACQPPADKSTQDDTQ